MVCISGGDARLPVIRAWIALLSVSKGSHYRILKLIYWASYQSYQRGILASVEEIIWTTSAFLIFTLNNPTLMSPASNYEMFLKSVNEPFDLGLDLYLIWANNPTKFQTCI